MATSDGPKKWVIDDHWQAKHSGHNCEFCDDLRSGNESGLGTVVGDLRTSRWILGRNQHIRGYSILVLKGHSVELFDLDPLVRHKFADDIADASALLNAELDPIKINLEMQGNVEPHLHCHVKPRFANDTPGHARIFQDAQIIEPPRTEMLMLRDSLRRRAGAAAIRIND